MKSLLTPRETEILQLMYKILTNKEIAEIMHISMHTVKVHINEIFKKLQSRNRLEAVVTALRLGILEL